MLRWIGFKLLLSRCSLNFAQKFAVTACKSGVKLSYKAVMDTHKSSGSSNSTTEHSDGGNGSATEHTDSVRGKLVVEARLQSAMLSTPASNHVGRNLCTIVRFMYYCLIYVLMCSSSFMH